MPTFTPPPTVAPANTLAVTPVPTETPTSDSNSQDAIYLIFDAHDFIINELNGLPQTITAEEIWCSNASEKRREMHALIEQYKPCSVYFKIVVIEMGQDQCHRLQIRYIGEAGEAKASGLEICTVEQWAYLPEQAQRRTIAEMVFSTYYLDRTDGQFCISSAKKLRFWFNSDHINPDAWRFISSDAVWPPTPSPIQ